MRRRNVLLTMLAVFGAAGSARTAGSESPVGRVWTVAGNAQAVRAGLDRALVVEAPVFADDTIRTGRDSKVRIEGFGGLTIIVGPVTEVRVDRFIVEQSGSLSVALRLARGIVRLIGGGLDGPSDIAVETPQAIAAVRSTDWLVELTEAGTGVFVAHGRVAVDGRAGGSVALDPGEGTDVAPGRPPSEPRRWGAARRDAALARTQL